MSLLKILLTNYCIYDCQYCVNRVTSDTPRARFTPEEVVRLTLEFYKRNYIEGLFLSSGIIQSADYTMEQLVEVARRLREVHHYNGYIHLKAVPGASEELMAQAGRYADRLSANIELPTQADLRPARAGEDARRDRDDDERRSACASPQSKAERRESRKAPPFAPAGQSTQMIVGATPSTDATILAHRVAPVRPAQAPPGLLLRLQPDPARRRPAARRSRRRSCASTGSTRPTG